MGRSGVIRQALSVLFVVAAVGLSALFTTAQPASADQLCVGPGGTFVACGAPGQAPVVPGSALSTPASSPPVSSAPLSSKSAASKPAASVPSPSGTDSTTRRTASSSGRGVPGWADAIGIALIGVDLVVLGAVLRSGRRRSAARRWPTRGPVAGRTGSAPTAGLP